MEKVITKKIARAVFLMFGLICCFSLSGYSQEIAIKGTVTDDDNSPIPGVNIMIKGTTVGTVTDAEGNYSLNLNNANTVLVYSFVGYVTQEVPVTGRTTIDVTLVEDMQRLDEVVVVGYGTQKRSDLTGSIKSIDMDDIPPSSNINLAQSLRGYAAGLNVQGGSTAGTEPGISVRGQTSLSASERPLIVLDGIIFDGSISDINVADVERIDVLKDASAAAIYGSRSANGVLLITTNYALMTERFGEQNDVFGSGDVYWDLFRYGNQNPPTNTETIWAIQFEPLLD